MVMCVSGVAQAAIALLTAGILGNYRLQHDKAQAGSRVGLDLAPVEGKLPGGFPNGAACGAPGVLTGYVELIGVSQIHRQVALD